MSADLRSSYDVVVVGGGPAGCAFAASLAARGVAADTILVVDKDRFPRSKVCGDGWTHHAVPLLRAIFPELADRVPSASFVTTMEVWFPALGRGRRFLQNTDVVPRELLDAALWAAVRARGVHAVDGARVRRVLFDGPRASGVEVETAAGSATVACRLLVGADGSAGVVRKATGPVAGDRRIHAVRQYVRGLAHPLGELKFVLDHARAGYFWVFPFRDGEHHAANIGYIALRPGASDLLARFRELRATEPVATWLDGASAVGRAVAFPLNCAPPGLLGRVMLRPPWGEGYLLLGDAAALVAPYSGEGIAFALWSGQIAAELLDPDELDGATWKRRYERRLRRLVRWRQDRVLGLLLVAVPARLGPRATTAYLRLLHRLARVILRFRPTLGAGRVVAGGGAPPTSPARRFVA